MHRASTWTVCFALSSVACAGNQSGSYAVELEEETSDDLPTIVVVSETCTLYGLSTYFDRGSHVIAAENYTLDAVLSCLRGPLDRARIDLVGHTDGLGSARFNAELGHRRAENVARYLIDHGIGDARIQTRFGGVDGEPSDPRSRRVDIAFID